MWLNIPVKFVISVVRRRCLPGEPVSKEKLEEK